MTIYGFLIAILFVSPLIVWEIVGGLIAWKLLYSDHHQIPSRRTPADDGIESTSININLGDSKFIAAWMLTPTTKTNLGGACIVMVHGYDSGKDKLWEFPDDGDYSASTLDQGARSLWQAGFFVVAIDLRNHGQSSNNGPVTLGARESEDVLATVQYLVDNASELGIDPNKIALRGESMGGATCLIAAAKDKKGHVSAVWSDSAYCRADSAILDFIRYKGLPVLFAKPARRWLVRLTGVNLSEASPLDYIEQIQCPVFLTHSSDDTMLPLRHLDQLTQSDDWLITPQSWVVNGHQHNRLWREPEYQATQIQFFQTQLASESSPAKAA